MIAIAIVFRKGTETVGTVGGIITMIQMIPLAGVIITTEILVKTGEGNKLGIYFCICYIRKYDTNKSEFEALVKNSLAKEQTDKS